MLLKKILAVFCLLILILLIFNCWNVVLFLDDNHKNSIQTNILYSENNLPKEKPEYYIHINLDEYKMYVYKNNELINTYPICGGKPGTPSPLGKWKIINKAEWGEGFGGAWMGLNVPWGKYGIHGTLSPWLVGKSNLSKGCIRMKNQNARELYRIIPYGTTVSIAQKNPVFRQIKNGDIGSDVCMIQNALKELGYYNGSIDGKFGSGLSSSVKRFQKANNLAANGIVSKKTHNAIFKQLEIQRENDKLSVEP